MKNAGIVADDYKLKKFEEELTKAGFTNYKITSPFTKGTSVINVIVKNSQLNDVKKICLKVENHFKRGKN